jgi:hypothetical protein
MIVTPVKAGDQFESAWTPARFLQGLTDRDESLKLIRQLTDGIETCIKDPISGQIPLNTQHFLPTN